MNNQDKNTYVKQQITTTLLELLKEKELSDINIGEITKKAQVSRNSFYRNYADKEDIIKNISISCYPNGIMNGNKKTLTRMQNYSGIFLCI